MDKRSSWVIGLLALFVTAAPAAQDSRGTLPGFGVPWLIPPGVVALEPQQREEIASLRRGLHDRYCELSAQLTDAQEQLRAALKPGQAGGQAAARLSEKVEALRREARAARTRAEERAQALLTEEQRVVLARWRGGRRGAAGEIEDVPYQVLPSIESDEPDIENLDDPELDPRY